MHASRLPNLICLSIALCACSLGSDNQKATAIESNDWQRITFHKIGMTIEIPSWGFVQPESTSRWLMLSMPLVDNPVTDIQYAVTVSIAKYPKYVHKLAFPPADEKMSNERRVNGSHIIPDKIAIGDDIYIIRDIFVRDDIVYRCKAHIQQTRLNGMYINDVMRLISSIRPIVPGRETDGREAVRK